MTGQADNWYLEKGVSVELLIKPTWGPKGSAAELPNKFPLSFGMQDCLRVLKKYYRDPNHKVRPGRMNCLIRRPDGELVVRPFRGLRKMKK